MIKQIGIALAALLAASFAIGETVRTATQPWVRSFVSTNTYTRAETDARISELAPRTSLTPATNYTDSAVAGLRGDIPGIVTNCFVEVSDWSVYTNGAQAVGWTAWTYSADVSMEGSGLELRVGTDGDKGTPDGFSVATQTVPPGADVRWGDRYEITVGYEEWYEDLGEGDTIEISRTRRWRSVYGFAFTNDIPTVSAWAMAANKPTYTAREVGATTLEEVTAAIREQSLGGIWDSQLEVWWTPIMANGSLNYCATTNVNMEAEQ